ncbi:hypothetical protein [Pseudogemmobacter sp. W21_MBD1_M6]|uniref:hypothetical protein n=1 Tax=Pseudogemmobacter sp. W21_MBD1_M6 TaxID=3240271 RepID=UPI003F983DB4
MATMFGRRPSGLLAWDDLQGHAGKIRGALEKDASGFAEAVLTTLKGPAAQLPVPYYFQDI